MARSARGSLSATHESDSRRCCRSLEEVHATDGSRNCLSHPEDRVSHPAAVSSAGKAGEGTCAGSVFGLCTAGNTQASAEAEWVRVFAGRSAKTTGGHSQRGHCTANGGRARDLATTHHQTRRAAAKNSSPAENYTARAFGAATNSKM